MPEVNPKILEWARVTAGLSLEEAAQKLGITGNKGARRVFEYESGEREPSRSRLVKIAKLYRRPLLTFYMAEPPKKGARGEDFRTLPSGQPKAAEALVDALLRDIRARQGIVRSIIEDDDESQRLSFVGAFRMSDGVAQVVKSIRNTVGVSIEEFRRQGSPDKAFGLLRTRTEEAGIFVLLIGNLGSHHTAFDVELFRGFALADELAPFIVINNQDARAAWSFTLLHELAHIWLGASGVSGSNFDTGVERFCNDVASEFLLPGHELEQIEFNGAGGLEPLIVKIEEFARQRCISRSMVAYRLYRHGAITKEEWLQLRGFFRSQWLTEQRRHREQNRASDGGPSYYQVRKYHVGSALLKLIERTMREGDLTPSRAGKVLGVRPNNVELLFRT